MHYWGEKVWKRKEAVITVLNLTEKLDEKNFLSDNLWELLFNKCLLNTFSVPGSMLGTNETTINKIVIIPVFMEFIGQRTYGNIQRIYSNKSSGKGSLCCYAVINEERLIHMLGRGEWGNFPGETVTYIQLTPSVWISGFLWLGPFWLGLGLSPILWLSTLSWS